MQLITLVAPLLLAHATTPIGPRDLPWSREAWPMEFPVLAMLLLTSGAYFTGLRRLWARAGTGKGVPVWRAWMFGGGMGSLAVALCSPVAAVGAALFWVHMLQHVLLMLVAAPLLVLGLPQRVLPLALPSAHRHRTGRVLHRIAPRGAVRLITHPASAWLLHAAAVLIWHAPPVFDASLRSEAAHMVQHLAFFGTALLFWHALGAHGHSTRMPAGVGLLYVFTTSLYGVVLGAGIALANHPLYAGYEGRTEPWGLSTLEDQQLAGFVMWVPAGLVYVGAGLVLLAVWLRAADRSDRRGVYRPYRGAHSQLLVILCTSVVLGGCNRESAVQSPAFAAGGSAERAAEAVRMYGCATCHQIDGIAGANGRVGPPLSGVAARRVLAGRIPNSAENFVRFTVDPYAIDSASLMPVTGIVESQARDIAAYLYAQP